MSLLFKKNIKLSMSYKIIIALLLCAVLAPIYANEPAVYYYAFVMQNKNGVWELPTDQELKPGDIYRFQMVKVSLGQKAKWVALRGAFHFVKDPLGGVKVVVRKNLDQSPHVGHNIASSLWDDESRDKTWEKLGRPEVQPLIDEMTKKKPGAPDPNFMRFLVRKNEVKTSWVWNGNTYQIVRLHYLIKHSSTVADENDLKLFSHFLKPSDSPTTNITKLKDWMKNQKSFQSAGYLGQADELHEAFYQDFYHVLDNFLTKSAIHFATLNIQRAQAQIELAERKRAQQAMIDVNSHLLEAEHKLTKAQEMVGHIAEIQRNQIQIEMSQLQIRIDALKQHVVQSAPIKPQDNDNAVLLILIIGITTIVLFVIAAWFYPEKLRNLWPSAKTDDEIDPYFTEEQSIVSQSIAPVSKRGHIKSARYISKEELSSSLQTLRNPLLERIIAIEKMLGIEETVADSGKEKQAFLKDSAETPFGLSDESKQKENLPLLLSKAELGGFVEKAVEDFLATHFFDLFSQSLKKLSQEEKFEEVVRQQVLAYLNNNQFKTGLNATLESYTENHLNIYLNQLRENNISVPRYSTHSTMGNKMVGAKSSSRVMNETQVRETATANPIGESEQADSERHEVIEKIKTVLSSMDSVDKAALNELTVCAEPGIFLNHVIADCLKLNQPVTHYQRLDHAIGELTEGKVTLIIPNVGDEFIPAEHNAVAQQTANKGKLNVVATLARPGIKCDKVVRRKAEVVQTV